MLGLYLYTLIISHKSYKMLSILNKLTLQKDVQNIVKNYVFMDQKNCGPDIFNKFNFSLIFYMQFLIFTGVGFIA